MTKAAELAKMGEVLTNSQIGSRRNMIINGGMNIFQRSTSATGLGASSGYFSADRFRIFSVGTAGRVTMSQSSDTPEGFGNSLKIDVTTADTSIAADELFILSYAMEGQDAQMIKKGTSEAESLTMSFYAKANASANYVVEMFDNDNTRNNTQAFTVTSSWQRFSFTFVPDTSGALDDDNALSFYPIQIWLHGGSTYSGGTFASNTWGSVTNANRYAGSRTSIFDSTDREFYITGVQVEVGSVATPFEHRSFGEELQLCKRYCNVIAPINDEAFTFGYVRTSTTCVGTIRLHPVMRGTPTLAFSGVTEFQVQHANSSTQTTDMTAIELSTEGVTFNATVGSGLTAGQGAAIREHTTGASVTADAEL